ncbi:thiol:disulfide interchange protein [Pedobacter sp. BAL39]|uniref:TlpA disulfide reductase family protein n=1 Tax=Pedobacter sp. BAL39 TaxID=391596 RepID=UPI000155AC6F|nr:TlpA disulfide reductase family protein [Pedobacter sp. BAL39]EDM34149.1 thiol:disulfide interchange protein [Pedobacter sp. BAL39]
MKYILLGLFLFTGMAWAQDAPQKGGFSISGTITGKKSGFIYLSYAGAGGKYILDSAALKGGKFQFRGQIDEPGAAIVMGSSTVRNMDDPELGQLFIEPAEMQLRLTAGDFKQLKLTGSKTQDEQEELELQKAAINAEKKPFVDAYRKEKDHEKAAAIREQFEPFDKKLDALDLTFMNSHPDSYLSAYMMRFKIQVLTADQAKDIYDRWTPRIKNSVFGKETAAEIAQLQNGSPGSKASVFSVKDINGQTLDLSSFKGSKYVMLDFWASWCVPCRKGNPHLIALYNRYKDKGFEIIGVASDDTSPDAWRKAVEQDQIGIWKHVLSGLKRTKDGYDRSECISEPYGIHTLPTKILIDKEGMIVGRYGGGGEDDAAMDRKLAELFN